MPKPITREQVERMSPEQRLSLHDNTRRRDTPETREVCRLLEADGLLDGDGGGLPRHHPTIRAIEAICRSEAGVAAALAAAGRGEAPLAGVDPLLAADVPDYGRFDTTGWAGGFVIEEVEARRWEMRGRKSLPPNSVAKTAAFFVPRDGG